MASRSVTGRHKQTPPTDTCSFSSKDTDWPGHTLTGQKQFRWKVFQGGSVRIQTWNICFSCLARVKIVILTWFCSMRRVCDPFNDSQDLLADFQLNASLWKPQWTGVFSHTTWPLASFSDGLKTLYPDTWMSKTGLSVRVKGQTGVQCLSAAVVIRQNSEADIFIYLFLFFLLRMWDAWILQ